MFKRLLLPSLVVFVYAGYSYATDNIVVDDPSSNLQPMAADNSTPQEMAITSPSNSPTDLINPTPGAPINDNVLNNAGLYPMGGQMLIDRNIRVSGSVILSSVSVSTVAFSDGTSMVTAAAASKVKQILSGSSASAFSTTSATFQTTNSSVTITPSSSADCFIILAGGTLLNNKASVTTAQATIFRGSTNLGAGGGTDLAEIAGPLASGSWFPGFMMVNDCPATTSATTYSVKIASSDGATTVNWGFDGKTFITAVEYAP